MGRQLSIDCSCCPQRRAAILSNLKHSAKPIASKSLPVAYFILFQGKKAQHFPIHLQLLTHLDLETLKDRLKHDQKIVDKITELFSLSPLEGIESL